MQRDSSSSRKRHARSIAPACDPFEACSNEPNITFLPEALKTWFAASPARRAMVADCGQRFFDVAAVALGGYIISCEHAFIAWAGLYGPSADEQSACRKLATLKQAELNFPLE